MKWKMLLKSFFFIFLLLSVRTFAIEPVALKNCILHEEDHQLSVLLKFDNQVTYHCMLLKDPERLVIDLNHAELKTTLSPSNNSDFIKQLRTSDHDHEFLRFVFDLKQDINYKTSLSLENNELTITLTPAKSSKKVAASNDKKDTVDSIEKSVEQPEELLTPINLSKNLAIQPKPVIRATQSHKAKNIVIVIDPGHGGKDPGAAGPHGTSEKEVVLKISKELQAMLNEEAGFCAVLTRSTDCYIPLRKRLAIARKNHADMFIAIHADAYHHSQATGASVYALSQRGATSEAAKWLADKENESELGGLSTELADKDAILRSVLIDLSQTHTIESSLLIGDTVLQNLGRLAKLHHPRVEQAAFVVLKSPDIPSILVETGFLSNPDEEEKLINKGYQHQTAYAIKEGIKRYFLANSPGGTWFSDNRQKMQDIAIDDISVPKKHRKNK